MVRIGTGASVAGLLAFGTMTSLFSKLVYEISGEGLDGAEHYFRKPWFMTTLMFVGMSFCLPLAYLEERAAAAAARAAGPSSLEPLLAGDDGDADAPKRGFFQLQEVMMFAIPTTFDLVASVLMNVGLLTVTASVYQMMRGAEMVFAAVLSVVFLKRHLNRMHLGGIALCIVGIVLVGLSSLLSGEGGTQVQVSQMQILLGMLLIVLSQCVQAAQVTFEDYFMSELSISPMKIVGYEGVIGASLMIFVLTPIVRVLPGQEGGGVREDIMDTLHMIASNGRLLAILTAQMLGLLAYNYAGMHVTGHLGAVFRTVLETMRTLFVWLLGLALFYLQTGLGESWNAFSPLQAGGFCVLVAGTMVYGRGDERAASQAVAEYLHSQSGDIEAQAVVAAGHSVPVSAPATHESVARPMRLSSSLRANQSLYGGSYHEALASSLRSQGVAWD